MDETTHDARTNDIERRVEAWASGATATAGTSGVGVTATASRSVSLPDAELEVQPEQWAVRVVLRLAAEDEGRGADVLRAIGAANGTVTLEGGDAAEIAWPADAADAAFTTDGDGSDDRPLGCEVPVGVTIPWPSRTDETARPA